MSLLTNQNRVIDASETDTMFLCSMTNSTEFIMSEFITTPACSNVHAMGVTLTDSQTRALRILCCKVQTTLHSNVSEQTFDLYECVSPGPFQPACFCASVCCMVLLGTDGKHVLCLAFNPWQRFTNNLVLQRLRTGASGPNLFST